MGLGFRALGLGFGVYGLGFGVLGLGFRVLGLGFGVYGLGFGALLGFGAYGLGFGVLELGFSVLGWGKLWGLGLGDDYKRFKDTTTLYERAAGLTRLRAASSRRAAAKRAGATFQRSRCDSCVCHRGTCQP